MQGAVTTATVRLFVTAFVTAFVTVSSNTVVKSYSVIAFIQKSKKQKKWGWGLDQTKERLIDWLMAFKSLSSQDLSQDSISEVNNVILNPGFIKDGEDKGKQLEN